ncbi:uncharacterized protein LOC114283947 [Camellia sinensis]|uniref:uncharacterized protein LOC114283947 n=1 Tax=Camellia sinensis TaxID=4442 RepID=UPI001035C56B|nr:uncharacterized protein LOC114283947 [Camellia sinensis]
MTDLLSYGNPDRDIEQLKEMTEELPPEMSNSETFKDIHAQVEAFLWAEFKCLIPILPCQQTWCVTNKISMIELHLLMGLLTINIIRWESIWMVQELETYHRMVKIQKLNEIKNLT